MSNTRTQSESEPFLWKIQVHKSMTRLHFVMPFEIYKKDNVCNILQKLTNSSIIQNNLLMCSDLYRDFFLLKNFQMECMRENSRIEMTYKLWKRWAILWKMLSPGHSKWHMLTLQSHDVQSVGTDCSCTCAACNPLPLLPPDLKCDLSSTNAGDRISRTNSSFYVVRMVLG